MDVPDVRPGNTIRLPVSVEGAYFYTGDAHAAQGDGELCGVACEMTARVRLRLTVEKGRPVAWPRIESDTELMAVGSARPMEDAARIAWVELIDWLVADYGFDRLEAYQLLTHAGRLRVGNMVDPQYSVVAKIDAPLPPRPKGRLMYDLLVTGGTVVTATLNEPLDVAVQGERIAALGAPGSFGSDARKVVDATG